MTKSVKTYCLESKITKLLTVLFEKLSANILSNVKSKIFKNFRKFWCFLFWFEVSTKHTW